MTTRFFSFLLLVALSRVVVAQTGPVVIDDDYSIVFEETVSARKESFIGFHVHYMVSGEFIALREDIFKGLITDEDIPVAGLTPGFYLTGVSFMRNWLFSGLNFSYLPGNESSNDLLRSRLGQQSIAGKFGVNLVKSKYGIVSPYLEIRYTRFRHHTAFKQRKVTIDDYLDLREIDLRVSQFTGAVGINYMVTFQGIWSAGLYGGYMFGLRSDPMIRSRSSTILNPGIPNPIKNFGFGLLFGMGMNTF